MKVRYVSGNIVRILNTDALLKCSGIVAMGAYFETSKSYDGLYTIKKTDSSANAITIYPATGETIDGESSVTLTTENEYKTFAPVDGGWTVVDAYTVTPSFTSPVLTTPLIADGGTGVTITSADQTHATPVVTIPNIGDAADEFVMKDTAQNLANKTVTSPTLILKNGTPVNAVASTLTVAAADIALIGADDTVGFGGSTFTKVASDPAAGEFTDTAGLNALINALTAWNSAIDGSDIDITAAVKGTASDGTVLTITKLEDTTADGAEAAKATATIAAATLAQLAVGDTVTFDSVVFTKAASTSVEDDEFADTAGLISCIDAMTDWAATASTADIAIEAAEVGEAPNGKTIVVALKRATDNGADGTLGSQWEIRVDNSAIYICVAANTVADGNWEKVAIASY